MSILQRISVLLYPPKCVLCQKILGKEETDLCRSCRTDTEEYTHKKEKISFVASQTVLWYYKENVRSSLLRYKFLGRRGYASVYAQLLAAKLLRSDVSFDLITWVPISAARKRRRGYDQVELIAKALSRELSVESVCTLKKIRNNKAQSSITGAAQRKANVLGAYKPANAEAFRGKRVLLLDDIITTGATMSECARVLMTFGARTVLGAAVAAASPNSKKQ